MAETLIVLDSEIRDGHSYWLCRCTCGVEKWIAARHVKDGSTKSCGCLRVKLTSERKRRHGLTKSRTYRIWGHILTRCLNSKDKNYSRYGGRGITVCERWLKFENFYEDMGEAPNGLSIDRIDNNGSYCKENCKWSTALEQSRNRRNLKFITIDGVTKPLWFWVEQRGLRYSVVHKRLRRGWSSETALEMKVLNGRS